MNSKLYQILSCLCALAVIGTASAEGSITVSKEVVVDMSAKKAWTLVSGFCDIAAWHPVVEYCDMSGKKPVPGSTRRTLTLGNGAQLHEQLTAYNAGGMTYSYTIPDAMGVLPVRNYKSTLQVEAMGSDKAKVTWSGNFDPQDPADPAGAEEAIGGVYQGGLDMIHMQAKAMMMN